MKTNSFKYVILILVLILMSSCNRTKELNDKSQLDSSSRYDLLEENQSGDNSKIDEYDTENPKIFSNYISLGSYSEIIRLGGSQRDPKKVLINNNSIIFPEGMLVNITTKTNGTFDKFLDITPDKAREFLSIIESQKLIDEELIKNPARRLIGAEARLILLNTAGKYMLIEIYTFDDNIHRFNVKYEDEEIEDGDYYIESEVLTEKIKELSNWKYVDREQLQNAMKAICRNVDTGKEIELTPDELKNLVNAIRKAKNASADYAKPFNISFEVTLKTGELIHMIWAGDSSGIIGVEGSAYDLDKSYVSQLEDMLKEKKMIDYLR